MQIAWFSHQGPRENLEDAATAVTIFGPRSGFNQVAIPMVLDGVGGNAHGEKASALAGTAIATCMTGRLTPSVIATDISSLAADDVLDALVQALETANTAILDQAQEDPALTGMATTVVAAVLVRHALYVAWAGDSRCYVHTQGQLHRVTRDHSHVQRLVDDGLLTPHEARHHPMSHTITRYLGNPNGYQPETRVFPVHDGDIVVLTTDGVTDALTDDELCERLTVWQANGVSVAEISEHLVRDALDAGTGDNCTVLCCRLDTAPSERAALPAFNLTCTQLYPAALAAALQSHRSHKEQRHA